MYETFYGLREKPFSLVPDPDFLFLGRLHGAALNMLEYGLRGQASFTLISGEVGCGKTILIRKLLRMVDNSTTIGMVTNTPRSKGHTLERILLAFDLNYRGKSEVEQYEILINFLEEQQTRGRRMVLIIDEAHNLDEDSLEELRMLSNINVDKSLALQVILVGQPEILELLNTRSLRQLAQRISVNFRLLPLTFFETRRYIRHRLRVAGGSPDIFEPKAISVIHLLSGGIPRLINVLCDAALVYGFGEGRESLDAAMIQAVASDMLRGGLETLPATSHDLETGDILEAADRLVASLDSDQQDDECVELPPLPPHSANLTLTSNAIMPEADRTGPSQDNSGDGNAEAVGDLGAPTVIPIVDTSATEQDGGGGRRRMILMLAIFAAIVVIVGGLLWFSWPAFKKTGTSSNDSANQLTASDRSAAADTRPVTPVSPQPGEDIPVGQKGSPAVPIPVQKPSGEITENDTSLADSPVEDIARPPSSEPIAVSPPETPVEPPANADTSRSEAGEGEPEARAVLDDETTGRDVITKPATLHDVLNRSGGGGGDFNGAMTGLFALWKQDFPALAGAKPCSKVSKTGLSCYERNGSLRKLKRSNRPAIIGLRGADQVTIYALLAGHDGETVRLLIDGHEILAPRGEVNSAMERSFTLLWKPPPGYQGLLVQGARGETILWLRTELEKILEGEVNLGSGDIFDAALTRAVRDFQERKGLKVDGIVGIETLIEINSASLGDEVPKLE